MCVCLPSAVGTSNFPFRVECARVCVNRQTIPDLIEISFRRKEMTTLTSRSLSLVPLQLNLSAVGNRMVSGSDSAATVATNNNNALMHHHHHHHHSLQAHGMNNCVSPSDPLYFSPKEERLSPNSSRYGSENSPKNSICDMDHHQQNRRNAKLIGANVMDDMSDARSSSVSSYQTDSFQKEPDCDQRSYCSDDSELSVGREVESGQRYINRNSKYMAAASDMESVDERMVGVDNDEDAMRYAAAAAAAAAAVGQLNHSKTVPGIVRPSPTRLQEEFLRKSQIYAEELMKHQMNFMAATRSLNISPKIGDHTFGYPVRPDARSPIRDDAKIGFRPHVRVNSDLEKKWSAIEDRNSQSPEGTNFRGIHSHLNAISKITSALGRDMIQLTSPGSMTSRENSQSPPTQHFQQLLNNNINEPNLKFSIDNILKPSFGRRITDPLLKRNKTARKSTQRSSAAAVTATEKHPIDLTGAQQTAASTLPVTATTAANSPTSPDAAAASSGEADKSSKGPMVWPAWVYCTRYSDRPSSGKLSMIKHFIKYCKLPANQWASSMHRQLTLNDGH